MPLGRGVSEQLCGAELPNALNHISFILPFPKNLCFFCHSLLKSTAVRYISFPRGHKHFSFLLFFISPPIPNNGVHSILYILSIVKSEKLFWHLPCALLHYLLASYIPKSWQIICGEQRRCDHWVFLLLRTGMHYSVAPRAAVLIAFTLAGELEDFCSRLDWWRRQCREQSMEPGLRAESKLSPQQRGSPGAIWGTSDKVHETSTTHFKGAKGKSLSAAVSKTNQYWTSTNVLTEPEFYIYKTKF